MRRPRLITLAYVTIFIVAAVLRIWPAVLNSDANDNHLKVIRIIATEDRIPGKDEPECLQCYHPKLYHLTAAKLTQVITADFKNRTWIISQIPNVIAGIATLVVAFFFLRLIPVPETARLLTFLLTALNPSLIGINIQGTNDSFVILFSSLALYTAYRFLTERRLAFLALAAISTALAALSKGSGLIILLGLSGILALRLIVSYADRAALKKSALALVLFLALSIPLIIVFGPYDEYFATYGSPLVLNKEKSPLPHLFEKTYVGGKTGIVSLYDGYMTFRLADLIKEPYLDRASAEGEYQPARTSLWTQLYARANFIQYEGHPDEWFTKLNNSVYQIGKIIYLLALLPLALFLVGTFLATKRSLAGLIRDRFAFLRDDASWIFPLFIIGFIAFSVKFSIEYREFSSMKPIYIYPALLAFTYALASGFSFAIDRLKRPLALWGIIILPTIILALLYAIDIVYLIKKLS